MDQHKYRTFIEAIEEVPDPRKARGKRYPWSFLLGLVSGALASGQQTAHAIAHRIVLHATELREESNPTRSDYLDRPGVGQGMVTVKTGEVTTETAYGIPSLRPSEAGAAELETLWRGHWTVENRTHYVRDVTMGEDACQSHTGKAPHALQWYPGLVAMERMVQHRRWPPVLWGVCPPCPGADWRCLWLTLTGPYTLFFCQAPVMVPGWCNPALSRQERQAAGNLSERTGSQIPEVLAC